MEPQNHRDLHDCGFKLVIFVPNFSAASTHSVVVSLEVATLEPTVLHVSPKKSQFHWTTNEVQKRTLIDPHPKCKKRIKSCKSCFMAKIQFSYIIASLVNLHSNSASFGRGGQMSTLLPGTEFATPARIRPGPSATARPQETTQWSQPTSMMDGSVDGKTENPSPEKEKNLRKTPSAKVVKGESNSRGFVDWLEYWREKQCS